MKTIKVYEICISDGCGGHSRSFYVEKFTAGTEWVRKHPLDDFYEREITIFEDLEDYDANSVEGRKKKALAKLTTEEKELLGLK